MRYTVAVKTNVTNLEQFQGVVPPEGEHPFPDRETAALAVGVMALALTGWQKTDILPFDMESDQLHFKMEKDDEFFEVHVHPAGEEVLSQKDLDKMFEDLYDHLTGETNDEVILGVMEDVYNKVHPSNTPLIPPLTTGEVRSIKGWWRTRWIVEELYNTCVGRATRLAFTEEFNWSEERLMQENVRVLNLFTRIETKQQECIDRLVKKAIAKFGDKPVDVQKSKELRERFIDHVVKMSGHQYSDNEYRHKYD